MNFAVPASVLLFVALIVLGGQLPSSAQASSGWETVRHNGQDYVTARSIKEFYGFQSLTVKGSFLELENKAVKIRFTIGGQEVFMNNVKFVFSFKVVPLKGRYLISRIDLGKLVDPVLRPSYIKTATHSTRSLSIPVMAAATPGRSTALGWSPNTILPYPEFSRNSLKPAASKS